MNKKWAFFSALALLAGGFVLFHSFSRTSFEGACAFCDTRVLDWQKFYEDDLVIALYTHKPVLPGHCLIVPKRHVERFEGLTNAEIAQMGRVIKKVDQAVGKVFGTSAYLLHQKNGLEVGQSVPHVHFHYVPRRAGDDSMVQFAFGIYWAYVRQPISQEEMHGTVASLRHAMLF